MVINLSKHLCFFVWVCTPFYAIVTVKCANTCAKLNSIISTFSLKKNPLITKTPNHIVAFWNLCSSNSGLLSALKFNLNRISRDEPLTFNINDDYPDTDYHEQQRHFTKAIEQYFPIQSPLERKCVQIVIDVVALHCNSLRSSRQTNTSFV